jgi:hypothetical protein
MLSPRLCRVATGVLIIRRYGKRKVAHWKFPWKFSLVAHSQIGADYNRNETPCKSQSRESADLARVKAFDAVPCDLLTNSQSPVGSLWHVGVDISTAYGPVPDRLKSTQPCYVVLLR